MLYLKIIILTFTLFFLYLILTLNKTHKNKWEIQSIDTMKYSRDLARDTLDHKTFNYSIDEQTRDIARTGATHISIGTPYDDEFLPVWRLWVKSARRNNLKVFFRGNFSGWEGWYGYKKIDGKTHTEKVERFILDNQELFEDGDIFSSCPECENGVGASKFTDNELIPYKLFLIKEYKVTKSAFNKIAKNVRSNYYAMNGDLALRIMDNETTKAFDGLVVIDHYVSTPEKLSSDIKRLAAHSGGQIMLGEFGAPIPNIHGDMSEFEKTEWIRSALVELDSIPEVIGVNYWVNVGGSTALWTDGGYPSDAVGALASFYKQ